MKTMTILLLLLSASMSNAQPLPPKPIAPYVNFLETQKLSAKQYIINLFDTYDIVVFCERTHDELTQYELLIDIMADKKFQDQVGDVFMEIGGSNFDAAMNNYLSAEKLTPEQNTQQALEIHRNMSWYPFWERYNYHYLLTSLYDINRSLAKDKKIRLHPTDIAIDWNEIKTSDDVKKKIANSKVQDSRDSIMGENINTYIAKNDASNAKRKKYFVILNTAHATKGICAFFGYPVKSATSYIFDKYGNRTANVLLNFESLLNMFSTNQALPETIPILEGKLDAAFEYLGIDDRGFDIKGSPLENQRFENMTMVDSLTTNEEVFTGYVFYKSFPKHDHVNGIPGIVSSTFKPEFIRRGKLWEKATSNANTSDSDWEIFVLANNQIKKRNPQGLQSYWQQVVHWTGGGKQILAFHSTVDSISATVDFIKQEKEKGSKSVYNVSESAINGFGYSLMTQGKVEDALIVFKLNTELYPEGWNTFDSLGECLATLGKKKEAIVAYQKSIALNPENENGMKLLEKLENE